MGMSFGGTTSSRPRNHECACPGGEQDANKNRDTGGQGRSRVGGGGITRAEPNTLPKRKDICLGKPFERDLRWGLTNNQGNRIERHSGVGVSGLESQYDAVAGVNDHGRSTGDCCDRGELPEQRRRASHDRADQQRETRGPPVDHRIRRSTLADVNDIAEDDGAGGRSGVRKLGIGSLRIALREDMVGRRHSRDDDDRGQSERVHRSHPVRLQWVHGSIPSESGSAAACARPDRLMVNTERPSGADQVLARPGRRSPSPAGWAVFAIGGWVFYSVYLGVVVWLGLTLRWVHSWDDLGWMLQVVQAVGIVLVTAMTGALFRLRTRRDWALGFALLIDILYVIPVMIPSLL